MDLYDLGFCLHRVISQRITSGPKSTGDSIILTERRQSCITGVPFCGYSLLNILHVCMDAGKILLYYFWNLHYIVASYLYKKHMHVGHAPTSFQLCGLSPITSNKGRNVSPRCLNKSQVFCNYTSYLSPRLSYSKIIFGWQYEEISHLHNSHFVFPLLKLEEKINDCPQSGAYVR